MMRLYWAIATNRENMAELLWSRSDDPFLSAFLVSYAYRNGQYPQSHKVCRAALPLAARSPLVAPQQAIKSAEYDTLAFNLLATLSGPIRGVQAALAFSIVDILSMALLYGCGGRLMATFRPGQ
jgi:hypothetical protein